MLSIEFPFPADVWGTVSDWVMITVTGFTALFLWRTLQSQKKVQDTQNRLFDIEHIRLREDYKPEFKYSRFYTKDPIAKNDEYIISICIININVFSD